MRKNPLLPGTLAAYPLLFGLISCGGNAAPSDEDPGEQDSGVRDAGTKDSSRPDSGVRDATASDDPRLNALAGRYLIRLDTIGDATSPSPLGTIGIHSLVSTLVVAQLTVNGNGLSAIERVCTQSIRQTCTELCTAATTSVDSRAITILRERQQKRTYTLEANGTFSGGRSVAQLGYDDEDFDAPVPEQSSDERIWDIDKNADVREGFQTALTVTVGLQIKCTVYGMQKFVSSFSGKLGGRPEAPEFSAMVLDTSKSEGFTLGSMPDGCAMMGGVANVNTDKSNARMVRYDELGDGLECPNDNSVFDEMLPPTSL